MQKLFFQAAFTLLLLWVSQFSFAADYYWVGGSGNWSDLSHWATTSGGTTGHVQVPTADDNVYFDINSFNGPGDVVTLNSDNVYFRDMRWDPTITGVTLTGAESVRMNIYGAFVLSPGMNYFFEGDLLFNSIQTGYQDIDAFGKNIGRSITFDSEDGQWSIASEISVDSLIRIQDGIVSIEPGVNVTSKFLEVAVDIEGSLIHEGIITLTGNNFDYLFRTYWVADLNLTNFVFLSSPNSLFFCSGSDVTIFVDGTGAGNMNVLDFNNPIGNARIEIEPNAFFLLDNVSMSSNGYFKGPQEIFELNLAPSKSYTWEPGYDYRIENLNASGSCSSPITLSSNISGIEASFSNDPAGGATVNGEYVNVKDIHISSGTFEVFNSLDLGNTAGWTINERVGTDLYWVGDGGDWSDADNWSTSSGGIGGACIPSALDNVFFDANSFTLPSQIVNIDIDDAFCKSMDWTGATGNPQLSSDAKNLHVNGSLILTDQMIFMLGGVTIFESNESGNTITCAGNTLDRNIRFTGAGDWTLQDTLRVENVLFHDAGTLITNDQAIYVVDYLSQSDLPRRLELGASTMHLAFGPGNAPEFGIRGMLFELDAGTSTINFPSNGYIYVEDGAGLEFNRVIMGSYGNIGNWRSDGLPLENRIKYLEMNIWGNLAAYYLLDTLKALPGSIINFPDNESIKLEYLNALGTCERPISLVSRFAGDRSEIETNTNNTDIAYAYIRDLHAIGSGSFTASNSVDLGNNVGWSIDANTPRTLYWVGGSGHWNELIHWSLTSGGPGGACIPTPNDDVIFDENSFSIDNEYVRGDFCYFRNMDWTSNDNITDIDWNQTFTYGSIYLSPNCNTLRWNGITLSGNNINNEIDLLGTTIGFGELIAKDGSWTFISDANVSGSFFLYRGQIDFGDNQFNIERLGFSDGTNLNVDFGSSTIHITGEYLFSAPLVSYLTIEPTIDPGTSMIFMDNAMTGLQYNSIPIDLHNVRCTDPTGFAKFDAFTNTSNIASFNKIQFDGDAEINGITSSDTLIFSPGKSYRLASGEVQTVNRHLQIVGNNCNSIELSSTEVGNLADIEIANFEVQGDFIQMRDIRIENPMPSYAGIHSTNIANSNQGWIFEDPPNQTNEEIGFFGDDLVLCDNSSLVLEAYPFNTSATFQWQDGSTENTLEVNTPGTYWARVTFDGACSIIDTVEVFPQDQFQVVLGNDTTLCDGESLLLDVSVSGAEYTWQDGSTDPTFNVTSAGQYSVDVSLTGCVISDMIDIGYQAYPVVNLGNDLTICENDEASFDVTTTNATYLWNDGSTGPVFSTDQPGQYSVNVTLNTCTSSDTILISLTPLAIVDIGNDTAVCEGTLLSVSVSDNADSYLWSNGSTNYFTNLDVGKQYLDVTLDGCVASDTINISSKPYPDFDLGRDTVLCDGDTLTLDLTGVGDSFLWHDGSTDPIFRITQGGLNEVEVGLNGCFTTDDKGANYLRYPEYDLGQDTTLCLGDGKILIGPMVNVTRLEWSDGSTRDSLVATSNGQYFLNAFNGRCRTSDTIDLQFNPKPVFDLGPDMTQCLGEIIDVDVTVEGASYTWSDGFDQPIRTIDVADTYWVDVLLDGCTVRDSLILNYVQIPSAGLGADTTLCDGEVLNFDFSSLSLEFEWQDGSINPVYSIATPGQYWLEVRDRDCGSRDTINVSYNTVPTVELGKDTMLCTGESIILISNHQAGENIMWSNGSIDNSIEVATSGSYWLEVERMGCTGRDEILVSFNEPPRFELGNDTLICEQTPLILAPGITNASYSWQNGSTDDYFEVSQSGLYTVEITKNGCSFSDEITIDTRRCTFYRAFLPEAFSPNGDGLNDEYLPLFSPELQITNYRMTIFDRWGTMLFMTEDPNIGWDGTFNQKPLMMGVFVYLVEIEYIDDRGPGQRMERGDFMILR